MNTKVCEYKTSYIRSLGALLLAPLLTTGILYVLTCIVYALFELLEKGQWALTFNDLQEMLVIAAVVLIIAFLCTLLFGLPLHCYLARRQNMQAKNYCFVAAAMMAPLFMLYAMGGAPGMLVGGIFVGTGILCAWLFWFIAVDHQRHPFKRACRRLLGLFE